MMMGITVPHLHLLLNHIPTVGGAAAVVLLLVAFARKSNDLKRVALEATYIVALFTFPAYLSGVGAQQTLLRIPDISQTFVDAHWNAALFTFVLFMHTLGLGIVAGVSAGLALRVLGFGRNIAMESLDRLFPVMWFGFILSALSGLALLATDPVTKLHQTVFYVKLLLVFLGVVNMQMLRNRVFRNAASASGVMPSNARMLAMTSLFFWIGATTAGRLIAYL